MELFEQPVFPDVSVGDYIRFCAILDPREVFTGGRMRRVPFMLAVEGEGMIRKINKAPRLCVPPRFAADWTPTVAPEMIRVRLVRVDTGPWMGVITAVLNGSRITGKPLTLES